MMRDSAPATGEHAASRGSNGGTGSKARPDPTDGARGVATRIGISLEHRIPAQALLNATLADASDLYSQTKQAHWNVRGPNFYQLHLLFDELAAKVEGHVDMLAERIRALGGTAMGTVRMAAAGSSLPEFPRDLSTDLAFVDALAVRYASYGARLRRGIEEGESLADAATVDLFTELLRAADQALYLLEAHLLPSSPAPP